MKMTIDNDDDEYPYRLESCPPEALGGTAVSDVYWRRSGYTVRTGLLQYCEVGGPDQAMANVCPSA